MTSPKIMITYAPPGEDLKQWEIETDSWLYGETIEIERHYGGDADDFFADARAGSHTARRILLWVIRRRDEPELQLDDLNDLRVSYLGFFQTKPVADPKEQAAGEVDESPAVESAPE